MNFTGEHDDHSNNRISKQSIGKLLIGGVAMNITNIKSTHNLKNQTAEWILPVSEPSAPVIET
ncbi:MAG TPA: hypothetical protein VF831_10680, partial [Anaerolineales bacterium]